MANEVESRAPNMKITSSDVVDYFKIVDKVLGLPLATSTRDAIMAHATALPVFLDRLVREELGADADAVVRDLVRRAYALLTVGAPTEETPCFSAYSYVREAASVTRGLLLAWVERNGAENS